jgi:hypothetical protein
MEVPAMSADRTEFIKDTTTNFATGTEISQRLRLIELCVEILIAQTKTGKIWVEGFEETTRLLETLPLASYEFNLARLRLKNALDYCQRGQIGAAVFELRLLRGSFTKLVK